MTIIESEGYKYFNLGYIEKVYLNVFFSNLYKYHLNLYFH